MYLNIYPIVIPNKFLDNKLHEDLLKEDKYIIGTIKNCKLLEDIKNQIPVDDEHKNDLILLLVQKRKEILYA